MLLRHSCSKQRLLIKRRPATSFPEVLSLGVLSARLRALSKSIELQRTLMNSAAIE